jgi:hypothetical protein
MFTYSLVPKNSKYLILIYNYGLKVKKELATRDPLVLFFHENHWFFSIFETIQTNSAFDSKILKRKWNQRFLF